MENNTEEQPTVNNTVKYTVKTVIINGKPIKVKVYPSQYDKYNNRGTMEARPSTGVLGW